jgi:hypothetical protein
MPLFLAGAGVAMLGIMTWEWYKANKKPKA